MTDREQHLGNTEGSQETPPPTKRGAERFPWKSLLLTLGLTTAGFTVTVFVFKPFDALPVETSGLRGMLTGYAGAFGFAIGVTLTGGLNIFRENVLSLRGHGELHPKSPSTLPRS